MVEVLKIVLDPSFPGPSHKRDSNASLTFVRSLGGIQLLLIFYWRMALLKFNQRFNYPVFFGLHYLVPLLHFVKAKSMGGHGRRIDLTLVY